MKRECPGDIRSFPVDGNDTIIISFSQKEIMQTNLGTRTKMRLAKAGRIIL